MKFLIIISTLFICCSPHIATDRTAFQASDTTISGKAESGTAPTSFYDLVNYTVLDSAVGNLNLDAYPDKILILKEKLEGPAHSASRPLLLLIGQPDQSLKLVERNDSVVMCVDCGGVFGDPYQGVEINNGYFTVAHYGGSSWRWTKNITFKYIKAQGTWYLASDNGISYHTSDPDKTEEIVTHKEDFGKLPFKEYRYLKSDF